MKLLVFAHRGEAQEFIRKLNLKPHRELKNTYTNDDLALSIIGEGIYDVLVNLTQVVSSLEVKSLINMGIAGSLSKDLELESIYSIQTAYAYSEKGPRFHSFSTSENNSIIDCITTDQRVLSDDFAKDLRPFAKIVDRELWAIGKVAASFKLPFKSYKLISDYAGSQTACFDLKERAKYFSNLMYEYFLSLKEEDSEEILEVQSAENLPIHLSFTQIKRVETLYKKIQTSSSLEELYSESKIDERPIKDKVKANHFITYLEEKVNPINKTIKASLENVFLPLTEIGAKVSTDPKLESMDFTLQMPINSETNIKKLKNALESFHYEDLEKLFQGKLDV